MDLKNIEKAFQFKEFFYIIDKYLQKYKHKEYSESERFQFITNGIFSGNYSEFFIKENNLYYNNKIILNINTFIDCYYDDILKIKDINKQVIVKYYENRKHDFIENNNAQYFIDSMKYIKYNNIYLTTFIETYSELKQIAPKNRSKLYDDFWYNVVRYQSVGLTFIQKYVNLIAANHKFSYYLSVSNPFFWHLDYSNIHKIKSSANKYSIEEEEK